MLGHREVWYWGAAVLFAAGGFVLAHTAPATLTGYAAVLTPICIGLYGGGLGKIYVETRNGAANSGQAKAQA